MTKKKSAPKVKVHVPSFPKFTLSKALEIPHKIKELNGGNAWDSGDVAEAVGMAPKSSNFFYLSAAARDFGLTVGTRETKSIELTALGRELCYAPDKETERKKKLEAFLNVQIFKEVLAYYKGSNLPEMKYLGNTLEREFKLPSGIHQEFSRLFRENCDELEIESGDPINESDVKNHSSDAPKTVVLGEPKGRSAGKFKAFVIIPFVERMPNRPKGFFAEVLRSLITPAAVDAGFTVETANKVGSDIIQATIINDLLEADIVIADLTDHNPNVMFELGVRMALDKPVAIIKSTDTSRIFDVDNMIRVYEYNPNLWPSTIEKDRSAIQDHVQGAWESKGTRTSYIKLLRRQDQAA